MKCYNCGFDLSESDFCTACGADVKLYKRIINLSNTFYNEGLEKAQVRDLSGARESLKLSLKCNKYNTEARNLLGLVYFETGDAVNAISEWVISRSFQPQKNIADSFMDLVQDNPAKWDSIRQTIIKYNKALEYSRQGSLDMAVIQLKSLLKINPRMVSAYQLLALLYIQNEEWEKASRCVSKALKIDSGNTTTLVYQKEIDAALTHIGSREQKGVVPRGKHKKEREVIEYVSGNETIIQPINHPEKNAAMTTILNIVLGLVIGVAIMWFLVLPGSIKSAQDRVNESMRENSSELEKKNAQIDELKRKVSSLEESNGELSRQIDGYTASDGPMGAINTLMRAAATYLEADPDPFEVASLIMSIDYDYATSDQVSEDFRELYTYMRSEVCEKASVEYMEKGIEKIKEDDYAAAIDALKNAVDMNDRNDEALYNLARAYELSEDREHAQEYYRLLVETMPESEYAETAGEHIDYSIPSSQEAPEQPEEEETSDEEGDAVAVITSDNMEESVTDTGNIQGNASGAADAQEGTLDDATAGAESAL